MENSKRAHILLFARTAMAAALLTCAAASAQAYPVGPALPLDQLVEKAEVIAKVEVLSSAQAEDPWFPAQQGYAVFATKMRIISVLKGDLKGEVVFRHYDTDPDYKDGVEYSPQAYHFAAGRCYILFAGRTDQPGILRQLWKGHTMREDLGAVLAADNKPLEKDVTASEAIWSELTRMLTAKEPADAAYAIRHLDEMSGGDRWAGTKDFDRQKALQAIVPLIGSKQPKVADAVLTAMAQLSPYRNEGEAVFWLATIGKGNIPGLVKREVGPNPAAKQYWKELVAVADGSAAPATRALAVRALGRADVKELLGPLGRWRSDPSPEVRQAAAVLMADFPVADVGAWLKTLAGDSEAKVRIGAAYAIGFAQAKPMLDVLDTLLGDTDENVRTAAGASLLSFGPADGRVLLLAHRNDPDLKSVFVNALAEEDPKPYLDDLAEIVVKGLEPRHFWGGYGPAERSWRLLYNYLDTVPPGDLTSGKFDKHLEALSQFKSLAKEQQARLKNLLERRHPAGPAA